MEKRKAKGATHISLSKQAKPKSTRSKKVKTEGPSDKMTAKELGIIFQGFDTNADNVFYSFNPEHNKLEFITDSVVHLTGYSSNEIKGDPSGFIRNIIHPDDKAVFENKVTGHKNMGKDAGLLVFEYRIIHKDGTHRRVSHGVFMNYDEKGKLLAVNGMLKGLPKMAGAGAAIERERDILNKYFQMANVIIVGIGTDQKVSMINRKGCELLGYSENEIIGKNWFEHFTPQSNSEELKRVFSQIMSGNLGATEYYENPIITKDGQEKLIAWHNTFLKDDSGKIASTLSSGEDISEKKIAEKALAESEKKYRLLVETMNDGIAVLDENGIMTYVNDRMCEMLEYTREEILGQPAYDFFDAENQKIISSQVERRRQGLINSYEISWRRKDGQNIHTIISPKPLLDDNGEYRGSFAVVTDITERKIANESLKASEANYRSIFNAVNDAIFVHDIETGQILDVNKKMCEMYGYTPEEIRFFSVEGISSGVFPYTIDRAVQYITLAAEGEPQLFEWQAKDKNGRVFWVEVNLKRATMGGKARILAVVRDITERKLVQEALAESQRALSTLMSNMPGMAYRCRNDLDYTMEFVSDGCTALTGYTPFELIDNRKIAYGQLIQADDQQAVWDAAQAGIEQYEPFQIIYRIKTADGKIKWVWEKGCGVYTRNGELTALEGFITDITALKDTQDALEAEKEGLAVTLRSIGDGVITSDTRGRVVLINKIAESLTGWTQSEAQGKPLNEVFKIVNELTREVTEDPVAKVLRVGMIIGLANHTSLISKDGTERSIADSGAPIRDKEGKIIGVVLVFREITEAKRLQEALARAQRLETASMVASQVAHDFNNLLAPLIAYPEFIKAELQTDNPAQKYLDDIETSAQQMAEINQQLLTLGRRGHYNLEPLNLNRLIEIAIKQIYPIPDTLEVLTELDNSLMNIKGGHSQILRMITNLIINAREAMHDIGTLNIKTENYYMDILSAKFGVVPMGVYVKLTVSDTGSGISGDIQAKIFDPFFTTKTSDRKRGSGLGLSVVSAVVEDHNGFIDLRSKEKQGTTFYIYFPITRETIEPSTPEDIIGGTEKLLVVDDDIIQREVTVRLLRKLGYDVFTVESGEMALDYLQNNRTDLLILDMIMPLGIDGTETFKKALDINPNQRAIVVSGYAESERVKEALAIGAGAFVKKPLTLKSLALAVRKELDKVAAARQE
jgi:two-component system cell cycle sensor histidine kinase/response regulator CckA